ncbi:MAG: transporter substrate-binding domain-containing protein [Desulfohalobiaceae bacterium]|nr:transporter substrate-binding domain-containing protein [Desulfohalobiaceae bacterium]
MRKAILLLTLALFLASSGPALAGDVLKIATEGAYRPFNYVKPDGTLAGFDVDIAHALAKEMGLDKEGYEMVIQEWDGMIPGLLARKFDVIVASMSITDKRKEAVAFTEPYYYETGSFVAKEGADLEISKEGLKGKTVGVQTATTWARYLEGVYGDVVDIKFYDSVQNHNLDLKSGRLDAVLATSFYMSSWLESEEGQGCEIVGEPVSDPEYIGEGVAIALRKGEKELKKRLNKALDAIIADGTHKKLARKYFSVDIYPYGKK